MLAPGLEVGREKIDPFEPEKTLTITACPGETLNFTVNYGLPALAGHKYWVGSVIFCPREDKQILASGGNDKTVKIWDIQTGRCLHILKGHTDSITSLSFHTDGDILASASYDNTIRLWNVKTGECLRTLTEHTRYVYSVAFSPDGKTLASGSYDKRIKLWNTNTGECFKTIREPDDKISSVCFSPDGMILAGAYWDGFIRLWDVKTWKKIKTLKGNVSYITSLCFSPDARILASGNWDNTVKLWDVETGNLLRSLRHTDDVETVAFSPDGKNLASGGKDKTIKLWGLKTWEMINPHNVKKIECLRTIGGRVNTVCFSHDGQILTSGNDSGNINQWRVHRFTFFARVSNTKMQLYFNDCTLSGDNPKTIEEGILNDEGRARFSYTIPKEGEGIEDVYYFEVVLSKLLPDEQVDEMVPQFCSNLVSIYLKPFLYVDDQEDIKTDAGEQTALIDYGRQYSYKIKVPKYEGKISEVAVYGSINRGHDSVEYSSEDKCQLELQAPKLLGSKGAEEIVRVGENEFEFEYIITDEKPIKYMQAVIVTERRNSPLVIARIASLPLLIFIPGCSPSEPPVVHGKGPYTYKGIHSITSVHFSKEDIDGKEYLCLAAASRCRKTGKYRIDIFRKINYYSKNVQIEKWIQAIKKRDPHGCLKDRKEKSVKVNSVCIGAHYDPIKKKSLPYGKNLVTGGDDGTIRFWVVDIVNDKLYENKNFNKPAEGVFDLKEKCKSTKIYKGGDGKPLTGLKVRCVRFSPDGQYLAIATNKGVLIYEVEYSGAVISGLSDKPINPEVNINRGNINGAWRYWFGSEAIEWSNNHLFKLRFRKQDEGSVPAAADSFANIENIYFDKYGSPYYIYLVYDNKGAYKGKKKPATEKFDFDNVKDGTFDKEDWTNRPTNDVEWLKQEPPYINKFRLLHKSQAKDSIWDRYLPNKYKTLKNWHAEEKEENLEIYSK